jgi:hypothetical protein
VSSDAYIRIGNRRVRWHGQTEHHDSLVFIDAPEQRPLTTLRQVPYALYSGAGTILLRADSPIESPTPDDPPTSRPGELAEQLQKLGLGQVPHGVLHQPVGLPSWIQGNVNDDEQPQLLERARAIEIEALLVWGKGVWQPDTYHYRLPSGEHASGFIRVADAIQGPRDAEALASWLHPHLADQAGIVIDTGTLSVLVQALIAAIRSRPGWAPGPVNVLDGYPATRLDVANAVRASAAANHVLALLSVNSSGRLRDHLTSALTDLPASAARSLHVLVDKNQIKDHAQDLDGVQISTWHPRPSADPLVPYDAETADACQWCRQTTTATVVTVSPRSFDGGLPGTLARITPSVPDAQRNRTLWEHADTVPGAIRLQAEPKPAVLEWRPPGAMPVVIDHAALIASPTFRKSAAAALQQQIHRSRATPATPDLVLMAQHEYDLPDRPALIKALKPILGENPTVAAFPAKDEWSDQLQDQIRKAARCIVVLALGAVTGTTLHGALTAIQATRHGPYKLYAYLLHARLTEQRAWETLENTYANQIFAAWHSYLPDRSPLQDEETTLQGISQQALDTLSADATGFLKARIELLASHDLDQNTALFWGTTPDTRLTPNSIFGQGLHAPAVYVAVGSAMERARQDERRNPAPMQRVFEMPAIARSYYDPMILSAIVRWLQPHEAWWGTQARDEHNVIHALLERAIPEYRAILIPELLLAAAQGKLNRQGTTVTQAFATTLLGDTTFTPQQRGPIELALALLPTYETTDAERQQAAGATAAIQAANTQRDLFKLLPAILRDLRNGTLTDSVANELELQITTILDK